MIKSMLLAAAIAVPTNPLCSPILAEEITSPKSIPAVTAALGGMNSFSNTNTPPAMSLYAVNIANNIACRSKARSKYFELNARDMSKDDSNAQWGTVGSMQALVWCRDTQAIIAVSGVNYESVRELREEIQKAF